MTGHQARVTPQHAASITDHDTAGYHVNCSCGFGRFLTTLGDAQMLRADHLRRNQAGTPGLYFEDGSPILCEWDGEHADKSLIWACGQPATTDYPDADTWACDAHAPAMTTWLTQKGKTPS